MTDAIADPVQGWDCHAHVFGPYARYPLAADRSYTPPEARVEQYLAQLARLGFAHGVLVHPSAYGSDASLLTDTLAANPGLRGVMVVRSGDAIAWNQLRARGVRAFRFSARSGTDTNFAGSAAFEDLLALAPRMADAGVHAELWTDCKTLPLLATAIARLPVPVVLDHMGGFSVASGPAEPGFGEILKLLANGRCWVKLSVYRNLIGQSDTEAGRAFHAAMLAANPQQLVWGSDWPHLRVAPAPDAVELLSLFRRWTPSADQQKQILVDNPSVLYR